VRVGKFHQHSLPRTFHDADNSGNEGNQEAGNSSGLRVHFNVSGGPQLSQPFENLQNACGAIARKQLDGLIAFEHNTETIGISPKGFRRGHGFNTRINADDSSDDCVLVRHRSRSLNYSVQEWQSPPGFVTRD